MTMLIAGHETTAAVLTWTVYCLSQHPQYLRRLQQEVRTKRLALTFSLLLVFTLTTGLLECQPYAAATATYCVATDARHS